MSLAKLPFILTAALGFHVAVTSPNAPSRDEAVVPTGISESILLPIIIWGHPLLKGVYWAGTVAEVTTILTPYISSLLPPSIRSILDLLGSHKMANMPITRPYMLGSGLVVFAGLLRWFCYRELGRLFTFALSFRKGHRLVTTGPYSVVRHPSYTGAIISMAGICIMHGSRGSWLRESGVLDMIGVKELVFAWVAVRFLAIASLVKRIPKEDDMMKASFQEEWLGWASRVKYRLIPGIY
ncbi:hypothetical protein BJ138DRAFT_1100837 [Hygrophoropsis aurantiaca]|uniref:Uncharacterized protein n=1 Tax=Hygrophoropsis aurantiaca TaxID=72124 RepID=A0ACB8AG66_9AGAM|nr:hypothetical protein BJ138DRAFT_1100837 [Hygrophoropsis aurantiaca]